MRRRKTAAFLIFWLIYSAAVIAVLLCGTAIILAVLFISQHTSDRLFDLVIPYELAVGAIAGLAIKLWNDRMTNQMVPIDAVRGHAR